LFQQPTVPSATKTPAAVRNTATATAAVIDLTFDDVPASTPTATKRKVTPLVNSTAKKQRKAPVIAYNDNDINEDAENVDFNESDLTALENYDFNRTSRPVIEKSSTTKNTSSISTAISSNGMEIPRNPNIQERLNKLQKSYIEVCEKRIALLVKRVSIEESLELSENDKRLKRAELNKQLSHLELKQDTLREQLSRLEQRSTIITAPPQIPTHEKAPTENLLPSHTVTMPGAGPSFNNSNIQVFDSSKTTQIPNNVIEPLDTPISDNDDDDFEQTPSRTTNSYQISKETRRLQLHPLPASQSTQVHHNHQQNVIESDEEVEDNDFGLVTSDPEEDHDTDLGGFIVDKNDLSEPDREYYHSASEAPVGDEEEDGIVPSIRVSQSEIDNLKNSSDDEGENHANNYADEEEVDDNDEDGLQVIDGASSSEAEDIQNETYRGASIRSEDTQAFNYDFDDPQNDDDMIDNNDEKFDEEREVDTQAVEIVDLDDSDLEFDNLTSHRDLRPITEDVVHEVDELELLPSSPGLQQQDDDLDDILGQLPLPSGEKFAWTSELWGKLKEVFKLDSFRTNQLEAINATLSGKDVFVLMPTGGGKSLCYQLPAIVKSGKTKGTTIVVSPLISLMQDQVEHLWEKDIPAGMISSKSPLDERKNTFHLFVTGQLKLLYLSPEMIGASTQAQNAINKLHREGNLARIVIDEAHCVSSWGHDFRPDYTSLSFFKTKYPDIPIMALTATANDHVRMDIVHSLKLEKAVELKQSFNRTNLYYEVLPKDKNHFKHLEESIRGRFKNQTGIIYCHSKNSCEQTADKLSNQGIKTAFYHAGMTPEDRFMIQKKWQSGEIKVICATIAFGMGIDKPDVRFVFHLTLPRTLEGYYQETGRAGRDGNYSHCVMYYTFRDAKNIQTMISKDKELDKAGKEKHLNKLIQVMQYCENNTDCRRKQVLQYFNEEFDKKNCQKNCDNCRRGITSELVEKDVTEHAKKLTNLVKSIQDDKVTLIHCQDVFKGLRYGKISGLGHDGNEFHGSGKDLDRRDIERIAFHLVTEKVLEEYSVLNGAGFTTSYVKAGRNAQSLLSNRKKIIMSFATTSRSSTRTAPNNNNKSNSTSAARSRTTTTGALSRTELNEYRLSSTPKIVSAKIHHERTSSNLGENSNEQQQIGVSTKKFAPKPIQLNEIKFNTEEERISFAKSVRALSDKRSQIMANLQYKNSSSVMTDVSLRQLAILLPTTEEGFKSITGLSNTQKGYFKFFRDILTKLKQVPINSESGNSASAKTSKYFSHQERENGQAVIAQIRASQASQASVAAGPQESSSQTRSKKGRRSTKHGGGYRKRYTSSSQKSTKSSSSKLGIKKGQSAMPI
jgi:bloom syndrome protein